MTGEEVVSILINDMGFNPKIAERTIQISQSMGDYQHLCELLKEYKPNRDINNK